MKPNKVTAVLVRSSQNQTPGSILIFMDLAMNPAGRTKATTLLETDSIGSGTLPGPNRARHERKGAFYLKLWHTCACCMNIQTGAVNDTLDTIPLMNVVECLLGFRKRKLMGYKSCQPNTS
jgi:hypothetical protein